MPKINISDALLEREDDAKILCQSCRAAADGDGPYCETCRYYWEEDAPAMAAQDDELWWREDDDTPAFGGHGTAPETQRNNEQCWPILAVTTHIFPVFPGVSGVNWGNE